LLAVEDKLLQGLKLVSSSSRCPEKDLCWGTPCYTLGLDRLDAVLIPGCVQSDRVLSHDLLIQLGSQAGWVFADKLPARQRESVFQILKFIRRKGLPLLSPTPHRYTIKIYSPSGNWHIP